MANHYQVGADVRCWVTFQDSSGAAQDPTGVNFKYLDAGASSASYKHGVDAELVKSAKGIYYVDVDADESGAWRYRWWSTGTGKAAEEGYFRVEESRVD